MVHESTHTPAVERAVARAHAHGVAAQLVSTVPAGFEATEYYHVGSFSTRGKVYLVAITYSAAGVDASCTCEGGYFGTVCQHVAAALEAADALPRVVDPTTPAFDLTAFLAEGEADRRRCLDGGRA